MDRTTGTPPLEYDREHAYELARKAAAADIPLKLQLLL
jgi:hypothetical protein